MPLMQKKTVLYPRIAEETQGNNSFATIIHPLTRRPKILFLHFSTEKGKRQKLLSGWRVIHPAMQVNHEVYSCNHF